MSIVIRKAGELGIDSLAASSDTLLKVAAEGAESRVLRSLESFIDPIGLM